jgi:biotin operon repressor
VQELEQLGYDVDVLRERVYTMEGYDRLINLFNNLQDEIDKLASEA